MKLFESFGLDTANQCLWRNGAQITVAPMPFAVLRYMVENPGRLITHDELLDALWPETYVQPQVLKTYMWELRRLLGDDARQSRFIQTLSKRGYRFVAPVADHSDTPHPPSADRPSPEPAQPSDIFGRDAQLAQLNAMLPLAGDERRVVFITGQAGIGKTALVDALLRQVNHSCAASVARGQCVQGVGGKEEFYPVIEALAQLCASPDGERACRTLARIAPAWHVSGREPSAAGHAANERTVGDLCVALEELAAQTPLILIFEDMHWADHSTLNLVSALARRRAPAKLMLLATYMPRKAAAELPLKGLIQDLLMHRLCAEIALEPLPRNAVTELLDRKLEHQLPPELADFVYQHSEGNPLFVNAVLEHLIAQRLLVRQGANGTAQWQLRGPLPEHSAIEGQLPNELARMIELEIERLTPEEQKLLEAGSLMSVVFPAWAVAAALKKDPADTEEACDELVRRLYFVERAGHDELPDGTRTAFYVFAHKLYREVLYERQSPACRSRRQIRIAERLRSLFAGRESVVAREVARLYEAAGEWRGAVDALSSSAQQEIARGSCSGATELFELALRITENFGDTEREAAADRIRRDLSRLQQALPATEISE